MKRIIVATLSTLVLSTLVAPGAKAIRPELLPQRIHPTLSAEKSPALTSENKTEETKKTVAMPDQKTTSNRMKQQESEEATFEYREKVYREKYGS